MTDAELFMKALQTIHDGQIWIDNGKIRALLHNPSPKGNTHAHESFSKREREIVVLITRGLTNREIGVRLIISEQAVKANISRIFRKADVTSRTQLAPLALKFGVESTSLPRT